MFICNMLWDVICRLSKKLGMSCSVFLSRCPALHGVVVGTKLFGRIGPDHPINVETLHLRLKLAHLLFLHLPPPAEEVHVPIVVRLSERADHQAVWTGSAEDAQGEVGHGVVEAAAVAVLEPQLRSCVLTASVKPDAARQLHAGGPVDKDDAGAVLAFELRLVCGIAESDCNKSPSAHKKIGVDLIQRPEQVLTRQRGRAADRRHIEEKDHAQSKHFS